MMTTPVERFAHTSATANRELPIQTGSPKSFDTVTLQRRGFDTVGIVREEKDREKK